MIRICALLKFRYTISWLIIFFYGLILFLPEPMKINAPGPIGLIASYFFNFGICCIVACVLAIVGEFFQRINSYLFFVWHCICAILISLYGISELFLISVFSLQWNAFTFQLLSETNSKETIGFFETYGHVWQFYASIIAFVVIFTIIIILFKKIGLSRISNSRKNIVLRCCFFVLLFGLAVFESPCFSLDANKNYNRSDKLIRRDGLWNLYQTVLMYNADKDLLNICIDSQKAIGLIESTKKSKNIVLVIGETYNRHHSSLYGYELETMPECKTFDRFVFSDVISPVNATTTVFKYLLSFSEVLGDKRWCDTPLFPAIFKEAGYNVVFYSNQYVSEGNLGFYDASAGFFNHPAIYSQLFNSRNHKRFGFDKDLVLDYQQSRDNLESESLNLIIFHLMGQHSPAVERYPYEFKVFSYLNYDRPDLSQEQRQYIADYDNATRYNDAVVAEIVRMYEEKDAIVLYVADHGEEIYDFRDKAGRFYDFDKTGADGLRNQLDVPFIVFPSSVYQLNHLETVTSIASAVDKPFMTDLLPHLLLGLAGIDCKWYDATKDLFSPYYDITRKRIVSGTDIDYDEVCGRWSL